MYYGLLTASSLRSVPASAGMFNIIALLHQSISLVVVYFYIFKTTDFIEFPLVIVIRITIYVTFYK